MAKSPTRQVKNLNATEIFCTHFLLYNFNATQAYKKSHPHSAKSKNVSTLASKFLNKESTQERLAELAADYFHDIDQDIIDLINETKRIAGFNPMQIMTINPDGKPELDLSKAQDSPEVMRMMDVEFSSSVDKDGCIHHTYKVKPLDKLTAFEKLFKYYKLYQATGNETEKRPIHVNVDFSLPGDHWRTGKPVPKEVDDYIEGQLT